MRKSYSSEFKAKVAVEAIKGERTMAELSSRYEVHGTLIGQWRKTLLERVIEIFSDGRARKELGDEAEKARLYEEIGRLKVELDWVKKKSGLLGR
jgi:putative transposase